MGLTAAFFKIFSDLHFNTIFFDANFYGDPILYQHLFWFFGHPEVYILIIPAFGVISQTISTSVSTILFAFQSKILAMVCISFLGTIVWSHHLYTVGLEVDTRAYFSAVTMLISLPTGTKIFNWLTTFYFTNLPFVFTHIFYSTLLLGYNTFIHMINSTLLYYNFYFTILGINITFIPLHFLGFNSMPRRISDYPDLIISWNFLSSSGS